MKSLLLSLTLSFALLSAPIVAQFDKQSYKVATNLFDNGDYRRAIEYLHAAVNSDAEHVNSNFLLGACYLKVGEAEKALPFLKKAYELDQSINVEIEYMLGEAYQATGKSEDAVKMYETFLGRFNKSQITPEAVAKVNKRINECKVAQELVSNPVKAVIENVGPVINSPYPDYTPVINADESIMMFTSRRPGNIGGDRKAPYLDQEELFEYEDIYTSTRVDGKWTTPVNLGPPVNTIDHDAAIALSPDGNTLFMYKDVGKGDIYVSKREGLNWTKPRSISNKINTSKYNEPSVSITADGKTLYFSSDRPGGYGGLDIYSSTLDERGNWSDPVNLGPKINTPEDDDSPFIHPDGVTLYFSSKGHATMGGFDIFRTTKLSQKAWSEPENLGYPINTTNNDIYFVLSADNRHGYYASQKTGGYGKHDIYLITMPKAEDVEKMKTATATVLPGAGAPADVPRKLVTVAVQKAKSNVTILKGVIRDELTKQPIEADISLVNNKTGTKVTDVKSNSANGSYLIILPPGSDYGISVSKTGYLFHSENFVVTDTAEYTEIVKDVDLKKAAVGTRIVLRNIFFDFDKATIRPESNTELEKLLKVLQDNPTMKIEISGHTDNKGSAEYNQKLSEARAQAVVNWLIKKGIPKTRMTYAGYGLTRPIASNDTDQGRQLNRRTEFEITSF
jgi:outer membrane protein OmpA-like peptidoglycan-associated protein